MTDFALIASLMAYVCFSAIIYQANGKILPSLFAGLVNAVLIGSLLHVGMTASAATLGTLFVLGSILAPIFSIDMNSKNAFTSGNDVLVNRETLGNLSMTIRIAHPLASQVVPQSQAA